MKFRTARLHYAAGPQGGGGVVTPPAPAHTFATDEELNAFVNKRMEDLLPSRVESAINDRFKNHPPLEEIQTLQAAAQELEELKKNSGGGKKPAGTFSEEEVQERIQAAAAEWAEEKKALETQMAEDNQLIENLVVTNSIIEAASKPGSKAIDGGLNDIVGRLSGEMKVERYKDPSGKPAARPMVVNANGDPVYAGVDRMSVEKRVEALMKDAPHLFTAPASVTAGGGGGGPQNLGGFHTGNGVQANSTSGFQTGPTNLTPGQAPPGQAPPGQAPQGAPPVQNGQQGPTPTTSDLMARSPMLGAFANALGSVANNIQGAPPQ